MEVEMFVSVSNFKRILWNKLSGSIYWLLVWPYASIVFKSNPHYPAYLEPISIFLVSSESSAPKGYYTSMPYILNDILPAVCFWIVWIVILIVLPSPKFKSKSKFKKP